ARCRRRLPPAVGPETTGAVGRAKRDTFASAPPEAAHPPTASSVALSHARSETASTPSTLTHHHIGPVRIGHQYSEVSSRGTLYSLLAVQTTCPKMALAAPGTGLG